MSNDPPKSIGEQKAPQSVEAEGAADPTTADFDDLNAALSTVLPADLSGAEAGGNKTDVLGELADDMLIVLRRLQVIEDSLARLSTRVDEVDGRIFETGRFLGGELAAQRRDLLGERKGMLARGLFNAVVGHLDALRAMKKSLAGAEPRCDEQDSPVAGQLEAIEITLITALQGMGFSEFCAHVGDAFSPGSMECLGYVSGEPGIVLRAIRPGFATPEGIVRPAGVFIAEPQNELSNEQAAVDQP